MDGQRIKQVNAWMWCYKQCHTCISRHGCQHLPQLHSRLYACVGQQACHWNCARHPVGVPADDQAGLLHQEGPVHEHPDVAGGLGWAGTHACSP